MKRLFLKPDGTPTSLFWATLVSALIIACSVASHLMVGPK